MARSTQRGRHATLLLMVPAVLAVASCSSTGVKTQSDSPTPSTSATTSSTATSTSSTPSPSDSATRTTGFGDAQPAVDVFVNLSAAYNNALQSPATASATSFSQYVAGQAKIVFEQSLAQEKSDGKAFRGTPPADRLIVKSSDLTSAVPAVTLEDCVLESTSDPWIEYDVATGKVVPTSTPPKVPPPYPATIKVFKPDAAGWVVTSYTLDGTKTCSR